MKKTAAIILAAGLALGAAQVPVHAASSWGSHELKKGQIGRVTALQNTDIYVKSGSQWKKFSVMKKGQTSRVYTNRSGSYGIGGGKFVKSSAAVKYETPSKSRYEAVNGLKIEKVSYPNAPISYFKVSGAANASAEKKINETLKKEADRLYAAYTDLKKKEAEDKKQWEKDGKNYPWRPYEFEGTAEVKFNKNHLLSVVTYGYEYFGGAHGMTGAHSLNFNTLTGKQFQLSDVIHSKFKTVSAYVLKDLKNHQEEKGIDPGLKKVDIKNSSTWVFTDKGIKIIFGQYEVGPYASGMPESTVPMSVYQ
ncbi:DUF3298 and DUF4163 domain-containing protein [Metabacillus sp. GX 13764]|uniref:DUF3298 and DUF4163 domain-containing protein n=1 Tax=Metabacillus kandeliae TaxID=2900151 RepID=UPI001E5DBA99|nr:DUF3298 and DUF4163 domain-containing protein [Metabacillus kandeliae]MCD7035528.1 DUF3298 and DUF4163 domain-containing protein [Metabacillus kandeliae]